MHWPNLQYISFTHFLRNADTYLYAYLDWMAAMLLNLSMKQWPHRIPLNKYNCENYTLFAIRGIITEVVMRDAEIKERTSIALYLNATSVKFFSSVNIAFL